MRARPVVGIVVAFASLGCDREREVVAATPAAQIDDAHDPAIAPTAAPVAADPPAPAVPTLAVSDRLPRLATLAADGTEGCGPCRVGKGPRLVVFGSAEAIARGEAWRDLDAIARLYADNGLGALAVIVAFAEGRAQAVTDTAAITEAIAEVRRQRRVVMPVDVALGRAAGEAQALGDAPAIALDPTVVLIDRDDAVHWVGGVGAHWRDLDVAITRVLAAP